MFWAAAVTMTAILTAGWVIVAIVNRVAEAKQKQREAELSIERDYLRRMLLELEEIKARLAARDRDAVLAPHSGSP